MFLIKPLNYFIKFIKWITLWSLYYSSNYCSKGFRHFSFQTLNMFLFFCVSFQNTDDICFVVYALINMLWATLYLELWKRRSATCAYSWGTLDREDDLLVEPRPLFHVDV